MSKVTLTGNEVVAHGMRQIEPDVVAAYPITPQTDVVQHFSSFVADGAVKTEFVTVESEHSAMSAAIGAANGGARCMTATSSQGLALMWEVVYIAASFRLPIVMAVVNRALSGPINIHCDHSDSMGARDSGWIQLYAENAQEAYDNLIQAIRIGEHPDVRLPVMVCYDGFIISHAAETVDLLADGQVRDFIGPYNPGRHLLDPDHPITVGALALYDSYFEHKRAQAEAMRRALPVIEAVAADYAKLSGRSYSTFEAYKLADAEVAVVVLNSTAGTAKDVVDDLRAGGAKVGLLKPRVFRPLPVSELVAALADKEVVVVLDRADSMNAFGGPLFTDIRAALYDSPKRPLVINYIYGLGGRDTGVDDLAHVFQEGLRLARGGKPELIVNYLGVRE